MAPPYRQHLFVCTNRRDPNDPRGDCGSKGGEALQKRFKEELAERGLKGDVRANAAGCLDACKQGIAVVVYPEGVWYARVTEDDVSEIVGEHVVGGKPVERLRMPPMKKAPKNEPT